MTDHAWTPAYSDADLTFWMSLYKNREAACVCLEQLRRYFPQALVLVRSDGDLHPQHQMLVERHHVEYFAEPPLFSVENGAAIVQRMLEMFLARPTRYLFKIDPDTVVHRRFRYLPAGEGLFGTLQGGPAYRSVQGGCLGLTLESARRIAQSGLLLDPAFRQPAIRKGESRYWEVLARRAERTGLASFDWSLGWVASQLGIALIDFPEVHCKWREPVDNHGLHFAVTHPGNQSTLRSTASV